MAFTGACDLLLMSLWIFGFSIKLFLQNFSVTVLFVSEL